MMHLLRQSASFGTVFIFTLHGLCYVIMWTLNGHLIQKVYRIMLSALNSMGISQCVLLRELSLLQWHSFSVYSSPLDGKCHHVFLMKVLGDCTEKPQLHIVDDSKEDFERATLATLF